MIADAFREVIESNISYVNGGNIRDSLLKGNITRKDIIDIMPFFNSLFVKEITGEAFLNALEFGVSKLPEAFGGFPQVSGCTFYVNTSFKSTVETDENGMFIKVGGQRRVSNVKINGKPLVLTQKYNLSASEYILSGGDGFTMFSQFPSVNESICAIGLQFKVLQMNSTSSLSMSLITIIFALAKKWRPKSFIASLNILF
jgi:2',3'-cyclic-nucleotide 2'-phosphodiesterase (5'-nucleotidase family)